MSDARLRLRATFNRVARLYDRVRPTYPAALFDDLVAFAGPGRVLEIGCGTGQATADLVRHGYRVHAIELGAHLAEVARERLGDAVRIDVGDFDHWTPDEAGFDVVFASTAFHWLDPATRYRRTADLLRPGGTLATVTTRNIIGGTEQFFVDAQSVFRRYDPQLPRGFRLPTPAQVRPDRDVGPRYEPPVFHRHEWEVEYVTGDYLDLLHTNSPQLAMPAPARAGMLREVGALIDSRFGGRVTLRYLAELRLARRATT